MNDSPISDDPAQCTSTGLLTVPLIPRAEEDLLLLQRRTSLSRTDLTNRAITLYEFFDARLRAGHDLIDRDNSTGETRLVQIVDPPAQEPVLPAFPTGRHARAVPQPEANVP